MSGGAWEYMASYREDTLGGSGFTEDPATTYGGKYFDVYAFDSTVESYNNRILGDATGKMGPFYLYQDKDGNNRRHNNWYADYSYFIDSSYSWFARGGSFNHSALAGQFYFAGHTGGVSGSGVGSRLVLVI